MEGLETESIQVQVFERCLLLSGSLSLRPWAFSLCGQEIRQNMPLNVKQLSITDAVAFDRTVVDKIMQLRLSDPHQLACCLDAQQILHLSTS